MKIYRDIKLRAFAVCLKDHRFRIGIYSSNVANHLNPHDECNNITPRFSDISSVFNIGSPAC